MDDKNWFKKYFQLYDNLYNDSLVNDLQELKEIFQHTNKNNNKIVLFGNGGSAAMASHVAVDLVKNASIKAITYNEYDLITCLANDYGFEHWMEKAIEYYCNDGDIVVLISSSGNSENVVNAAKKSKAMNLKVVTFTGFNSNNNLKALGDFNFWVDSKAYNVVEMTHQIWLLSVVDSIIGSAEYSAS